MKILLIDAYDSFVYIIKDYLQILGCKVDIVRNDRLVSVDYSKYHALVLGPGPGHPLESGYIKLVNDFAGEKPIFGVCLGLQAICIQYGSRVVKAESRLHGKTSLVKHNNSGCMVNLPNPLSVTRYHSLIAVESEIDRNALNIDAHSMDDNYVMAISHRHHLIQAVQFHPESILTQNGLDIFLNFLQAAKSSIKAS